MVHFDGSIKPVIFDFLDFTAFWDGLLFGNDFSVFLYDFSLNGFLRSNDGFAFIAARFEFGLGDLPVMIQLCKFIWRWYVFPRWNWLYWLSSVIIFNWPFLNHLVRIWSIVWLIACWFWNHSLWPYNDWVMDHSLSLWLYHFWNHSLWLYDWVRDHSLTLWLCYLFWKHCSSVDDFGDNHWLPFWEKECLPMAFGNECRPRGLIYWLINWLINDELLFFWKVWNICLLGVDDWLRFHNWWLWWNASSIDWLLWLR